MLTSVRQGPPFVSRDSGEDRLTQVPETASATDSPAVTCDHEENGSVRTLAHSDTAVLVFLIVTPLHRAE